VERTGAVRVVFDSLSEMRLLAEDSLRFRREALALKRFFAGRHTTVLFLDDKTDLESGPNLQLYSLVHGVISLDRRTLDFGPTRRRLEVAKMRAATYREGWHDYVLSHGGLRVFPRLVASEHYTSFVGDPVPSGLDELDSMLEGGPLRGTCTLLSGLAGTGKSTLALKYVHSAAERGEHCAIYQFDERAGTLLTRSGKLGLDLQPHIAAGRVLLRQIDPTELSPGEFDEMLRLDVEKNDTRLVLIDSLSGYLMSMPQEKQLMLKLHELLSYLNQSGVLTLMVSVQGSLIADPLSPLNVSHLADTVVLLSFFEAAGHVRKGLSIIKNRGGGHEDTIRELRIDSTGLRIGEILTSFHGMLSGAPVYTGRSGPLLENRPDN
jgi:circadian clock protein KaiC